MDPKDVRLLKSNLRTMKRYLALCCWCDGVLTPMKGTSQVSSSKKRKMKAGKMCEFAARQVKEAEKGELFVLFVICNGLKKSIINLTYNHFNRPHSRSNSITCGREQLTFCDSRLVKFSQIGRYPETRAVTKVQRPSKSEKII